MERPELRPRATRFPSPFGGSKLAVSSKQWRLWASKQFSQSLLPKHVEASTSRGFLEPASLATVSRLKVWRTQPAGPRSSTLCRLKAQGFRVQELIGFQSESFRALRCGTETVYDCLQRRELLSTGKEDCVVGTRALMHSHARPSSRL